MKAAVAAEVKNAEKMAAKEAQNAKLQAAKDAGVLTPEEYGQKVAALG